MGRRGRHRRLPQEPVEAMVESLSHDGRGVARVDGKATFIHGALPGEKVMFRYTGRRKKHDEAEVLEVLQPSEHRVEPRCPHFGLCGGCSLQHLDAAEQIRYKQQTLADAFTHIGKVQPETWLLPLTGDSPWGYRRKARLGVKNVPKKGRVLVGFRERSSGFLADMNSCEVLHPLIGGALNELSALVGSLSIASRVPQIEVAMDDERCVLVFRVLDALADDDREKLRRFAREHGFIIYIQEGGPDSVAPLDQDADLHYALPEFNLVLHFQPTDFTQVNSDINRRMLHQAMELLQPEARDTVLDLFCGIGNFTLPLATRAGTVVGVEGAAELVARARDNARRNDLDNVSFHAANLYESLETESWMKQSFNKALLDPPRSGAFEILQHLPAMGVERMVYVSCYPGTLGRDAGELVHKLGYRLVSAGVMDMFPHTAHVESIALFEKG
ncbi:23S rRNA (uracil(1939)-C(5))-methyltransferase RlmD [Thiolapillus brandeum]|uniref:23S rRNA (uracil(1939)-C(5))-methyltransferase RlmD n=1 Tax=Thiolapillus brandeum TaxID=1076588 RepID=A0A7U6JHU1_9GAMM|nr:23S rRNA (uracil(1939)-C(5))-methyltransferase RlmD [Thiolapillus brandeum]BAO44063.1 RNA methyltransferase TrmA family [Thiolapillus brandeum]